MAKKQASVIEERNKANEDYVQIIKDTWHEVAFDMLDAVQRETGKDSMSGEEVREIVADYIQAPGWWNLSREKRAALLLEALPEENWCM